MFAVRRHIRANLPIRYVFSVVKLAPLHVVPFDARFFDGEAKEAVAFALLALLHLESRPGNVPTATGARGPRILGSFTPA